MIPPKPSDARIVVKRAGDILLVRDKEHPDYSILNQERIVAQCGEANAELWFDKYVETGRIGDAENV